MKVGKGFSYKLVEIRMQTYNLSPRTRLLEAFRPAVGGMEESSGSEARNKGFEEKMAIETARSTYAYCSGFLLLVSWERKRCAPTQLYKQSYWYFNINING